MGMQEFRPLMYFPHHKLAVFIKIQMDWKVIDRACCFFFSHCIFFSYILLV